MLTIDGIGGDSTSDGTSRHEFVENFTCLLVNGQEIAAPVSGIVSRRTVEVGQHVNAGQQMVQIAQISDMWVTANFKETQLRRMRPGQRVTIHVDAFSEDLNGHVDSLPASTGAITSLLPPENATGNYVKVIQRMPVRIRFEPNQPALARLRPGMSVDPTVWVK